MSHFALATLVGYGLTTLSARVRRGAFFATFTAILLGVHSASTIALWPAVSAYGPLPSGIYAWCQAATFVHFFRLSRPRMRGALSRVAVSWPAMAFAAASFLALPWAALAALGAPTPGVWVPFGLAGLGLAQSIYTRPQQVHIALDGRDAGPLARCRAATPLGERTLRIVQISDPHLGPFMSVTRLRRICQRALATQPDLILLTGDFLTMESQRGPEPLAAALSPLRAATGRVFACFGNHDHEVPHVVREALRRADVRLLIDEAEIVQTSAGPVQLVGADFRWRDRHAHLRELSERFSRRAGHLRLWLLHDPGAFAALPAGEADLVLAGHTHGGHLGLLSLGLPYTVVSLFTAIPDHGLWARGTDRLYVHRGTGHYGFPLRLGVPAEESVLHVHW